VDPARLWAGNGWLVFLPLSPGTGIAKDEKAGIEQYRRAAEQGNPTAQLRNAAALEHGTVVEKNVQLAIENYNAEAEMGNAEAAAALRRLAKGRRIFKTAKTSDNSWNYLRCGLVNRYMRRWSEVFQGCDYERCITRCSTQR
jgi:TPR repeat protein